MKRPPTIIVVENSEVFGFTSYHGFKVIDPVMGRYGV
jgi:hypothetical protein